MPSPIRQIDGVQVLRAVAVLLVAVLHAQQELVEKKQSQFILPGVFGIDIFFVISGFILGTVVLRARSGPGIRTAWHFMERRLIRIFPVYWIYCLLSAIRLKHSGMHIGYVYLPSLLLLPYPLYLRGRYLLDLAWTLTFEMFFYVMLAVVQVFTVRRALASLLAALCALIVLGTVISIQRPVLIVVANPILLEFCLGVCIAWTYRASGRRRKLGMALTLAGAVMGVVLMMFYTGGANSMQMVLVNAGVFQRVATWGMAAVLLVLGVVLWSPDLSGPIAKIALAVGNASYSTYLAEVLVIQFVVRLLLAVLRPRLPVSAAMEAVLVTLTVVSVLVAGWLSYQFVEWPLLRRLQKLTKA